MPENKMSLIAYSNGIILADTVGVHNLESLYKTTMKKLFVSKNNEFAYAICGKQYLERERSVLETMLGIGLMVHLYKNKRAVPQFVPDKSGLDVLFQDSIILVATREQLFIVRGERKINDTVCVEYELTQTIAEGTYADAFLMAHAYGMKPVAAAKETLRFSVGVDEHIDWVRTSSLKKINIAKYVGRLNEAAKTDKKLKEYLEN